MQRCAHIGAGCSLDQSVNCGSNDIIGNGCKIQNNVSVCEGVELEDDVFCGPSCIFTNDLTLVAGIPARQIGWMCGCRAVLREEKFGEGIGGRAHKRLVCQSCGREYVEVEAGLKEKWG